VPEPDRPDPAPSWRDHLELLVGREPPSPLQWAAAAIAVLAVAVALVVWTRRDAPAAELSLPRADVPGSTSTTAPAADLVVQAAGAVTRPGVYRLPPGSRVVDLIDAAGGAVPGAAPDQLALAALLSDGERVYVPRVGEAVPPPVAGGSGGTPAGPLDLNRATIEELEELPGVGPATAQAIVDHRERNGPFGAVEELLDVRGIGEAKLDALRDLVRT
jgi:competence protein ComEA